jgi:predicted nuclease of restriction endonuclease-like (RecB) superfamily
VKKMKDEIVIAVKNIKSAILKSQTQVALDGNRIQLSLYFGIGKYISENTRSNFWGTGAIENISSQLQKEMPGLRGFSATNLKNMRTFFEE